MHSPSELLKQIETAIVEIEYPTYPATLYEPISYMMSLGGKRIRPTMLLMSVDLFNGQIEPAIPAALAIETFHNFTLIHDDIMDNAPLRRGKKTVHEKWNVNTAILSGDVMMVEANKHLTRVDVSVLKPALDTFNATAQGVCEGQQLDMEFESRDDVSIPEYIDMIRLKTAVLVGGAMKLGAIVAGATADHAGLIYSFGENLGIAFQLQDDILDVFGDPEKFGKQIAGDIIANKKTFLLLKLQELANADDLTELTSQFNNADLSDKIGNITKMYKSYKIREIATAEMKAYLDKAFDALNRIDVPESQKSQLISLSLELMNREK
ncbi:polyprenyl synthetase family protein [Pedobacter metabolipauper]|uniref:Geranylgeranyl diphosphate synthase type II n=1 Tax=Pedobacter metabolipauper TaxID=425513 RepID=A0A4R6SPC9_9SPHI|nr:polyprenyl synthetase family protein [Pedobacter metabolipauper]TDQ06393.1 geranylgeranyl diphosphate synthase type II [Pedobacter metabolipauper]